MSHPAADTQRALPDRGRRGELALALQEILTAIVRLRANRQVAADSESFRARAKQVLAAAEQSARAAGYAGADVRSALFAIVALLDESVLNSTQPMFADWSRRPLQEELFGGHVAGEVFFENLRALLERTDSEDTADVLEVYELCLLLGFRGRYGVTGATELQTIAARVGQKIDRVRGADAPFAPQWRPPGDDAPTAPSDPWTKRLAVTAIAMVVLALVLFVLYRVSLGSATADVATTAAAASARQ